MLKRFVKKFPVYLLVLVLAFYDSDVVLDVFDHSVVPDELACDDLCLLPFFEVDADCEVVSVFLDLINEVSF